MKQVSYLRLFVLLCGITLVIGETIKVDTAENTRKTTADNDTNKKGLSFTLFRRFIKLV